MFDSKTWYPRLADVPGVEFAGSPGVKREGLRNASVRPSKTQWGLSWEYRGMSTSASPSKEHIQDQLPDLPTPTLARKVWEALELPGTLADWHFLLMNASGTLWSRRRNEPGALLLCETFGSLDVQLAAAHPNEFLVDRSEPARGYLSVPTFDVLINLYRAADALPRALEVATVASTFGGDKHPKAAAELAALIRAGL